MDEINPYQAPPESIDEAFNDQTPIDPEYIEYASRWLRLGGSLLDFLILAPLIWMFTFWSGLHYLQKIEQEMSSVNDLLYPILLGTTVFLLFNGVLIYTRGQTIGKLICGTVVVTKGDFRQVSGNRYLFLRHFPVIFLSLIPFIGNFIGLIDSLAIFRSEKNCLHDDIAGTRVIMRGDLMRLRN